MEANAGLVAGSYKRNQLVVIPPELHGPRPLQHSTGQVCQICGDDVGITPTGELFVACNECAFPVCRPCYEYERKDGNQACPQCKTRYKRHKGSPRVLGDEEEEDVDDLENEFSYVDIHNPRQPRGPEQDHMSYGGAYTPHPPARSIPQIPLLTDGSHHVSGEFAGVSPDHPSLFTPPSGGKRIYPLPYADSNIPSSVESRSMDLSREFSPYEFGDIAWKERLDSWKSKQEKMQMVEGHAGGGDVDDNGQNLDPSMTDDGRQPLSRKVAIPSSKINPYRIVIVVRLSSSPIPQLSS